jgi:hypothetical protein
VKVFLLKFFWLKGERRKKKLRQLSAQISRTLPWNNPARLQLLELAERLERQAREFELQNQPAERVA